jgi:hypothetical protein
MIPSKSTPNKIIPYYPLLKLHFPHNLFPVAEAIISYKLVDTAEEEKDTRKPVISCTLI